MNTLGAIILVVSSGIIVFSILLSILGLSLRQERNLARSLFLELVDLRRKSRGRTRLAARFARAVLSLWRPLKLRALAASGLGTQALALELARNAFYINLAVVGLALAALMSMMGVVDLTNHYVVTHTSADLPIFFRLTAAWAGSSGSLLFWYFLLALFSAIVVYQTRDRLFNRLPVLFLSLGLLQLLFVLLTLFFKDAQPFRAYPVELAAGRGLNPLLLHWAMIIHPPILYIGYVSFAIPFAIAVSAVIARNLRDDWLPLMRRWTIFSWFFLGTGILLGSKWAYEELGWGGYWAWDPVENASLMPWLLATAFLHSLIVQERRGMLRFWNVILITLTYHMCLLGTWITRSGILEGPHTFAESTIGWPLITYIGLSFAFYMRYVFFMRAALRPQKEMEYVTSKEGSMLLNNFLMTLATVIVLVGVFSPLLPIDCRFEDGFVCNKVEWKQSAFNKVMVPLGLATLFLMGASPLLSWRKSAWSVWKKTLRLPLLAGLLGGAIFAFTYGLLFTRSAGPDSSAWGPGVVAEIFAVLTVAIACFVTWGLGQEFYQGIRSRRLRFGENVVLAFVRLVLRNKRRYGGYLAHLSIVLLFVGYSGAAFKKTDKFEFHYYRVNYEPGSDVIRYWSGDRAYMENYEIEARDFFLRPEFKEHADPANPIYFTIAQEAHYQIRRGRDAPRVSEERPENMSAFAWANRPHSRLNNFVKLTSGYVLDGRMRTERHFHPQISPMDGQSVRDQNGRAIHTPTSEPDIRSTWNEDIYIQLGAIADPVRGVSPDLNHAYEFYYYQTGRTEDAYRMLFPAAITTTLEVWVNPLVKFIWLGSLLFFFSGLIILLPFGERDNAGS